MWVIKGIALLAMLGLFLRLIGLIPDNFWRWLKGSWKSYYLAKPGDPNSPVLSTEHKLRVGAERILGFNPGWTIEISQGPFRRASAIYGNGNCWQIVRSQRLAWVYLADRLGFEVGTALRMINTYPSLRVMLDRIAELEKDLLVSNKRCGELRAVPKALLEVIAADRQKYRSQAAQHIRQFLEQVDMQATIMDVPNPSRDQIEFWKEIVAITI